MKDTYQIIILGPGGVGKTKGTNTLLVILNDLGFQTSEIKPWTEAMVTTSSYSISNFTIPGSYFNDINKEMNIVIYDMGGQFKYKEMWKMHAEDTDAIVVVVDMTRRTTLRQVPLMLPKGIMEGIPVRLLVNKADLYTTFSTKSDDLVKMIDAILQQTVAMGMVDYTVTYKGEEKFIFNSKVYKYGDQIPVMRQIKSENGVKVMKIADFEAVVATAFSRSMPGITDHNASLFGREFTLQVFDALSQAQGGTESMLSDELIESAHNEAPPFISWGNDPDVFVPVGDIKSEIIRQAVNSMLIEENDLWDMVERLTNMGYNIDIGDKQSWALTSAKIYEEDPNVNYKPMHKAVLPPYFIKKIIDYNKQKEQEEESFFV